jgi:tRNA threonylcarbamoyladenosine biosynthesis protein TsaB
MLILTIRTDRPEAEAGLFDSQTQLANITWQAHRALAETIHLKLKELLEKQNKSLKDLEGLVVFEGPGSFTGLRISFSVANALADSLQIPIVASGTDQWVKSGITDLLDGQDQKPVLPDYGAEPHITQQKK